MQWRFDKVAAGTGDVDEVISLDPEWPSGLGMDGDGVAALRGNGGGSCAGGGLDVLGIVGWSRAD